MARLCECGCGEDLGDMSEQARHKPGHRQRKYQRKQAARIREALAAVGGSAGVKTTATRANTRPGGHSRRRRRTRYALVPAQQLQPIATVEARDRRAAARMVDGDVVAIPERTLKIT